MGNLTRKGKPKLTVGNHAHKRMLSNPAIVRRVEMEHIGNALETEAKIETISYIETAHTIQYQRNKQFNQKLGRRPE